VRARRTPDVRPHIDKDGKSDAFRSKLQTLQDGARRDRSCRPPGFADGSFSFPITGGDVTYYKPGSIDPYVQGLVEHDGSGVSLTAGDTVAELTNFEIDPGTSKLYGDVSVNGESAAKHAFIFSLDGRTLKPLQTKGDDAILEGTKVMISDGAAGLLNDTFKTDAVKGGLLVGTATITIATK